MKDTTIMIELNRFVALMDCIYEANKNHLVRETIDSVIDVAYDLAEENEREQK